MGYGAVDRGGAGSAFVGEKSRGWVLTGSTTRVVRGVAVASFAVVMLLLAGGTAVAQGATHDMTVIIEGETAGQVTSSPPGIECGIGIDCSEPWEEGTEVTLTATPFEDARFSHWGGVCTDVQGPVCEVFMDSPQTVRAYFKWNRADLYLEISDSKDPVEVGETYTYTLTATNDGPDSAGRTYITTGIPYEIELGDFSDECQFNEEDGGEGGKSRWLTCWYDSIPAGQSRSISYEATALVEGEVIASGGTYATADFNLDNNYGTETTTVVAATNKLLSVSRRGQGTITSSPAGINCGTDCSQAYPNGTEVTLTANAASGHHFDSWGGACAGASGSTCVVQMDSHLNASVRFAPNPTAPVLADMEVTPPAPSRPYATIDASATTGAGKLSFTITGGAKLGALSSFETSPANPFTTVRIKQPGTYTVQLTAIGGGGKATATDTFVVPPTSKQVLDPRMQNVLVSTPKLDPYATTAVQATCTFLPKTQVVFGTADFRGCFQQVLASEQIPAPERAVGGEWFDSQLKKDGCGFIQIGDGKCFTKAEWLGVVYSESPVQFNGMTITPASGASVVLFPASGKVISSNAKVTLNSGDLGTITGHNGPLNLFAGTGNLTFAGGKFSVPLFSFNAKNLPKLGGFSLDGQMDLRIVAEGSRRYTDLSVSMTLPESFSTSANTRPSSKVSIQADNDRGLILGEVSLNVPEAYLGALRLTKLSFNYKALGEVPPTASPSCPRKWWKATAEIHFVPSNAKKKGAGLSLAPKPDRNGIAFCAGGLHSAGGILSFGEPIPPPQIFPGVFLDSIGFNMQLNPTVFSGEASITAAKIVKATGGVLAAFPSPRAPYVISAQDGGSTLAPLAGTRLTSTTFAVGGTVDMVLPGNNLLRMGNAYTMYSYPDYIKAAGHTRIQTFLFLIEAGGGLEVNTTTRRWDAYVNGDVCIAAGISIAGYRGCIGGLARASSRGMVACLTVIEDGFTPGIGYYWGDILPHIFNGVTDGCKPSHYWVQDVRAARLAAQELLASEEAGSGGDTELLSAAPPPQERAPAPVAFTLQRGDAAKDVEIRGVGGAPKVQVTAPDGETITSVPNDMQVGENLQTLAWEEYDFTWVGVTGGKPGKYLITPLEGSVPIESIHETRAEKDHIRGSVKGKGRKRTLSWNVGDVRGRTVTFVEQGEGVKETLKVVKGDKGAKGRISFEPAPGPKGERRIVAVAEVDGIPGPEQLIGKYTAPDPRKAPRVRKVRAKRKGAALLVAWKKAPHTTGYEVLVRQRDGVLKPITVPARRGKLRIKGVDKTRAGTASVTALGVVGDRGPAGTKSFKAAKKRPDTRRPFKELGKGYAKRNR